MGIFDKAESEAEDMAQKDPNLAQQAQQMGGGQGDMQTAQNMVGQQGGPQDSGDQNMGGQNMGGQDPNQQMGGQDQNMGNQDPNMQSGDQDQNMDQNQGQNQNY